jgi:hypothetical protein
MEQNEKNPRREFLGKLTTGAVAGFAALTTSFTATADTDESLSNADEWFKKLTGKHRMVFDVTQPHEIFPFAWPRVFLITNGATGTPEKECGVVVVLRHDAIGYAMEDRLWEKYKFGEVFKAKDPATGTAATRNPFAKPKPGDFKVPGLGQVAIGINELQSSGVMFCVCEAAITVYSAAVAQGANLDAAEVRKDWVAGLLPGIQVVPSGVWAVGRAQEHGCSYCFAG